MEALQILFGNLFDIFKLYIKFGIITLVLYFATEWYIVRYTDFETFGKPVPIIRPVTNSTVSKIFHFVWDFFLG